MQRYIFPLMIDLVAMCGPARTIVGIQVYSRPGARLKDFSVINRLSSYGTWHGLMLESSTLAVKPREFSVHW